MNNTSSSKTPTVHSHNQMLKPPVSFRLIACAIVGFVGGGLIGTLVSWKFAPLAIWDFGALTFLIWTWLAIHGRDAEATAALASQEDPSNTVSDVVLVMASIASLAGVGVLLFQTAGVSQGIRLLHVSVGIVSIIISWTVVHTIYILKYAREFYKRGGGINFHDTFPPSYSDFAYLGFTVGMTFQASDTDIKVSEIRKIVLRHALISFLFGTVIVATTINLIAGLGK